MYRHYATRLPILAGVFAVSAVQTGSVLAQDTQALIANALSAAPPDVAAHATVMVMSGEVLHQGDGAFTCFPYEGAGTAPMCLDGEWMKWAEAWMTKAAFTPSTVGLAYMLAGDGPDGGASNIDPFATAMTDDNQWVVEGPHVMILVPDKDAMASITTDSNSGTPYVMWSGTDYAHIMMPVAARN